MNWKQSIQKKRNTVIDFYHAKCLGTHFMVEHSQHKNKFELYIGTNTTPIGKFDTADAAIQNAESLARKLVSA